MYGLQCMCLVGRYMYVQIANVKSFSQGTDYYELCMNTYLSAYFVYNLDILQEKPWKYWMYGPYCKKLGLLRLHISGYDLTFRL